MAGRNVDVGDYAMARRTMRRDTRVQIAETLLGRAVVRNVQMHGADRARVRVDAPEPEEARKSERTIATVETDSRE